MSFQVYRPGSITIVGQWHSGESATGLYSLSTQKFFFKKFNFFFL